MILFLQELQSISTMDGRAMFERVLDCCLRWQQHEPESLIGIVAGATDVDSLKKIRESAPDIWILCPGVGAQGGEPCRVCPAGLRNDASGILISVSRALSKADDMAAAAIALRDEINQLRQEKVAAVAAAASAESSTHLRSYQRDFIEFALGQRALQFGSFTLKSGRTSPYFFNAGNLCSGRSISMLGRCYAQAIHDAGVQFDVIFGPAYKGIPLATAFAMAWFEMFGESKDVSYNRKEVKDHGEGGLLVGAAVSGQRVLIIDDVITAGTAIRESVNFLVASGAQIVGTVVSLDRQERAGDASLSAIQQVEQDFGFPVFSIVRLEELVRFLQTSEVSSIENLDQHLENMRSYRDTYGV
jgi:orotate phosphoribosyltransferase